MSEIYTLGLSGPTRDRGTSLDFQSISFDYQDTSFGLDPD